MRGSANLVDVPTQEMTGVEAENDLGETNPVKIEENDLAETNPVKTED